MNRKILWGVAGLVIGVLATGAILAFSTPSIMMKESVTRFENFEEAVALFEDSVADHGWKIPAAHDLQATMANYDHDVEPVMVYELCHPEHAARILSLDEERIVSSMMPCRVSIYEKSDGRVYVSWMNTGLMGRLFGGVISDVMQDASSDSYEMISTLL